MIRQFTEPIIIAARKAATHVRAAIIVLTTFSALAVCVLMARHSMNVHKRDMCQLYLRAVYATMTDYMQDNDGYYPPIPDKLIADSSEPLSEYPNRGTNGWVCSIMKGGKGGQIFKCEACPYPWTGTEVLHWTSYWMNHRLGSKSRVSVQYPSATLLFGDGDDGFDESDSNYHIERFPPDWLKDENSPMYRHLGGANYVFADGHVKWLRPPTILHYAGRADVFSPN